MPARTVDPIYVPATIVTLAATLPTNPQATVIDAGHGLLEAIDVLVPLGHAGKTGVRVELAGVAILPFSNPAQWITGDDTQETFAIGVEVDRGLQVITYNTGLFTHSHYLRFRVRQQWGSSGVPTAALLPNSQLGGP